MKQITVLQIISDLSDGGVEAMLMDIYRNIDYKTIRFIFVVQSSSRRYVDEIGEYGGKVYQVSPLHSVGMIAYMKNIIMQHEKKDWIWRQESMWFLLIAMIG